MVRPGILGNRHLPSERGDVAEDCDRKIFREGRQALPIRTDGESANLK